MPLLYHVPGLSTRHEYSFFVLIEGEWVGAYSFIGCVSHLTIDHASLSRRSTVPTPFRGTSIFWVLSTVL